MQTLISVVIPTYKRPQLLQKCLAKLVSQTFSKSDYEVIVVSDGRDEETRQAIEEMNPGDLRIRLLSLPSKQGPAAARNTGWKSATGILVAFTDDDCLPEKTWLEQIWKHYNYEDKIAFTGRVIVPVSNHPTDFEMNTKGLETGEFVTANCICTRSALQVITGFDEAFTSAWREDSDLHFKLLQHNIPISKLTDAIVIHPVRQAPWGVSMREQKKSMFNALLYKKYPHLYRQRIKAQPTWRYYFILLLFTVFIAAMLCRCMSISFIVLAAWLWLTAAFAIKRLSPAQKSVSHIFEMVVTSFAIPFLSVYWTLYGAIKYKVWFF